MPEQLSLNLSKTAILIMDYQNRQLNYFPESFQSELLAKANKVLEKARYKDIPVIYIEVVRGERTLEREIHPTISPQLGEPVLTKHRTHPFSTTNEERARDWCMLNELLKRQGIKTLALMGIQTSGCVLTTIRWATGALTHYQLIVLSDCCADRDDEVHRVLIEKMFPRQAIVVTAQEFIQALG